MRYHLILLFIGLISCKNSNKSEEKTDAQSVHSKFVLDSVKIGNKIFWVDSISKSDFEKLKSATFDESEENNLLKDSAFVERAGDTLILKISNGKAATFVNTKGENYGNYRYLGRFENIGQYLIDGSFDEWSTNYLISEITGDTTEICGIPAISPDNKFIIAGNVDLLAEFSFNGIDLFKIQDKFLSRIGRRELSGWGPSSIKWVKEDEIMMAIRVFDPNSSNGSLERHSYIRLKMN